MQKFGEVFIIGSPISVFTLYYHVMPKKKSPVTVKPNGIIVNLNLPSGVF